MFGFRIQKALLTDIFSSLINHIAHLVGLTLETIVQSLYAFIAHLTEGLSL